MHSEALAELVRSMDMNSDYELNMPGGCPLLLQSCEHFLPGNIRSPSLSYHGALPAQSSFNYG